MVYWRDLPVGIPAVDMSGAGDDPSGILQAIADADELGTTTVVLGQYGLVLAVIAPGDQVDLDALAEYASQQRIPAPRTGHTGGIMTASSGPGGVATESVTPARAQELLDGMHPSRRLNQEIVGEWARQMRAGLWSQEHPVRLDPAGHLVQGQHELAAIVEADVPVRITIEMEPEMNLEPDPVWWPEPDLDDPEPELEP